jgi:hypothetical protein
LICSRKRKVQLINPRHQCGQLKPCGVCSRDTKNQIFEIAPLIKAPDTKVYIKNMIKKIEQGRVTFEKDDEIHAIDVDKVVLALGQKPYGTELFYMLKQDGIETMIIGDAKEPAKIIDAVKEAFWAVMSQDF